MTNSNTPPPPPALTLVEKLYAVHNINSLVPEKLDLQESNYSTWSYFFKGHCSNFNVLNHIDGSTSTSDPPTDEWITADSIVKSWIFLTLSPTLQKRMISTNPASAKAAWDTIETIFQENKRTRTVALKGELRVIQMGDDTPDAYFSKIDSIITLLTDLGSTMDDDDIVTYAINGLSEKYGSLAQIIAHKDPFPDLATVRTMVTTEEIRLCGYGILGRSNTAYRHPYEARISLIKLEFSSCLFADSLMNLLKVHQIVYSKLLIGFSLLLLAGNLWCSGVLCIVLFAIVFASSSSEYSWSENRLKSGDLNSSRLNVLKCLQDDQNSRSGSLTDEFPSDNAKDADITNALLLPLAHGHEARHN
ncbi:hypothetical protein Tco_1088180 [Tanacetum coccineum]